MNIVKFLFNFKIFFILIILSGCSKLIIPTADVYQSGSNIVLMWEANSLHPIEYTQSTATLVFEIVDMVMADTFRPYRKELKKVNLTPITKDFYLNPYGTALQQFGMNVNMVYLSVNSKTIKKHNPEYNTFALADRNKAPYDFRYLKREGIDYVMYLDIEKFGVNRRGLLSRLTFQRPKATARFVLYLVDTSTNKLYGRYQFDKLSLVSRQWKQQDYQVFREDVAQHLIDGFQQAYQVFFEQ